MLFENFDYLSVANNVKEELNKKACEKIEDMKEELGTNLLMDEEDENEDENEVEFEDDEDSDDEEELDEEDDEDNLIRDDE